MTVSKLAWPVSSDAAALAVSCLFESPVRAVAGRSERVTGNKTAEHSLSTGNELMQRDSKLVALTALGYGFL